MKVKFVPFCSLSEVLLNGMIFLPKSKLSEFG